MSDNRERRWRVEVTGEVGAKSEALVESARLSMPFVAEKRLMIEVGTSGEISRAKPHLSVHVVGVHVSGKEVPAPEHLEFTADASAGPSLDEWFTCPHGESVGVVVQNDSDVPVRFCATFFGRLVN